MTKKEIVIRTLKAIYECVIIDMALYKELEDHTDVYDNSHLDVGVYGYYSSLNMIYLLMVGYGEKEYYQMFNAPGNPKEGTSRDTAPIAWYSNHYVKPYKKYSGYIPDAINGIILDHKNDDFEKKYKHLKKMFKTLEKLRKKHE